MTWALLLAAILLEVGATISLKMSQGFTRPRWIAPVVTGYVGALTLLGVILARGEMSVGAVYAIWAASGIALTAILGRLLFKDVITRKMYIGIILIVVGVIAVELGGH